MPNLNSIFIPNNVQEAFSDPKWKNVMVEEMKALYKNATWDLAELPWEKKTVECKWVFIVKHKADGIIEI